MANRGYDLIDVPIYERLWPDRDLIVAIHEHVRLLLPTLEPSLPSECELDLIASGTGHNKGLMILLGLWGPPNVKELVPNIWHLYEVVQTWCDSRSDEELRAIGQATVAPTWNELLALRVYPARNDGL